jgi:hypothetical protein
MGLKEKEGDDEMGLWRENAGGIRRMEEGRCSFCSIHTIPVLIIPNLPILYAHKIPRGIPSPKFVQARSIDPLL